MRECDSVDRESVFSVSHEGLSYVDLLHCPWDAASSSNNLTTLTIWYNRRQRTRPPNSIRNDFEAVMSTSGRVDGKRCPVWHM
jgi:hypothetical protein